mmetsp:Transcript_8042/g.9194  ORF Transcript_8042/g.9194 Transcript_8042/m.9194 type:complete len:140 (+) Transcript_8042:17-436(+)
MTMSASSSSHKNGTGKIISNGVIVSGSDNDTTPTTTTTSQSLRSGNYYDVFGFNLTGRQSFIGLGILSLMLGPRGTFFLLIAIGLYHVWNRIVVPSSSSSINNSSSSSNNANLSSSASGKGLSNVKGIKDLPCEPRRGG